MPTTPPFTGARRAGLRGRPDRQRHRHVASERRPIHAIPRPDEGRHRRPEATALDRQGGLDRELRAGYMGHLGSRKSRIWKTPCRYWKNSEKALSNQALRWGMV